MIFDHCRAIGVMRAVAVAFEVAVVLLLFDCSRGGKGSGGRSRKERGGWSRAREQHETGLRSSRIYESKGICRIAHTVSVSFQNHPHPHPQARRVFFIILPSPSS